MTAAAWLQFAAVVGLIFVSTPILGAYLAKVYGGDRAPGD